MELIWHRVLQPFLEVVVLFVAILFGLSLLDRLGYGLENVITRALNAAVVPKLNEIVERLDALEGRRN